MAGRKPNKNLQLDFTKAILTTADVDAKAISSPEISRLLLGGTPTNAKFAPNFSKASSAVVLPAETHQQQQQIFSHYNQHPQVFVQPSTFSIAAPTSIAGPIYATFHPQQQLQQAQGGTGVGIVGYQDPAANAPPIATEGKLAKKRERNRQAARRCRQKKMDEIGQLEQEVDHLKRENYSFEQQKRELEDLISKLQTELKEHKIKFGCVLDIPEI